MPKGGGTFCRRLLTMAAWEVNDKTRTAGGKLDAMSWDIVNLAFKLFCTSNSPKTLRSTSGVVFHNRTRISATPGQKKQAYAQVFPQKATRLAGVCLIDILSTAYANCETRFWIKILRILW